MHNLDTCGGAGCVWENDVSNAWSAQPHMITAEFIASDYIRIWKKTYEYCRKTFGSQRITENTWITKNIWIAEKNIWTTKTYGLQKKTYGPQKHMDCRKKHMDCRKNIWIAENYGLQKKHMDFQKRHMDHRKKHIENI